jgi:cystathionine beta-lyase/cystathionine gamma-synthase
MAAISALIGLVKQGDHVVVTDNVYGGTYRYFQQFMVDFGLTFTFVDTSDAANIEAALTPNTRMVFVETPTNPMLSLSDLREVADFCRSRELLMAVDNTFLSPYFQRPLELGADIVIHSSTKYLNGHSDVVGGAVIVDDKALAERLAFVQNAIGAVPGPTDCWLVLRSTKTLPLRMDRHNQNAIEIAQFLSGNPLVTKTLYPGLQSHPQHDLAKKQQLDPHGKPGFGGMISFEVGDWERAKNVMENVKIFSLAESLGGVESLISHPATMTHASIPPHERAKYGLTEGLVRISVGIEHIDDLIWDLGQALS